MSCSEQRIAQSDSIFCFQPIWIVTLLHWVEKCRSHPEYQYILLDIYNDLRDVKRDDPGVILQILL